MVKEDSKQKPVTFILLDGSVTTFGFRVLVDGVDTSQFERNPVMLYGHNDHSLPIGSWLNIRKENDRLLADANFDYDDPDPEVQRIIGKVERGIIKMASVGLRDPEMSTDEKYIVSGQTLPTVVKSSLREASIIPIGANNNAMKLYDHAGSLIDLSNEIKLMDFFNCSKGSNRVNRMTSQQANHYPYGNDSVPMFLKDKNYDELDKEGRLLYLKDNHPDVYQQKFNEKYRPDSSEFKNREEREFSKMSFDELDRRELISRVRKEYPELYKAKFVAKFGKQPETENKKSK